ncbi:uncharacterized protein BCR38DRAFT_340414 [Pseudomassariella vexata]|uniref:C2H2-type domain-containing protein n=1 Tax=Pseudomassariella vexata TaxID=1141098 RepID=A0A1Y2E4Z9_9PEZI|nr:uncharacterized protein BCR38DRAFT_340414 [Pseudomassariella vexata]ORY66366.1 hypothetical protein BCR38DRAFT_340414 [Pseudomassariella vexata]
MPDTADTSPKTPEPDDCLKSPNCADQQHTCRWIVSDEGAKHEHLCSRSFSTPIDLDKHLREDHLAHMSSKTKYKCLWKGCVRKDHQEFASRNKLRRHLSTHTSYKPFECKQCGEGFSAQQALDQHIRIHTGDKPYVCDVEGCDKAFKQKSALTMHKRTHTGEKPLVCEYCGKRFCESSNLSKHRKIHNPVYKHKCTEPGCGKEFIRLDQLRRHTEKHERQRKKTKDRLQRATPPELSIQVEPLYII